MNNAIVSLSIAARMTLNMHSLNNEGGEGNQIQTRMIDIVGEDHHLHNVNADDQFLARASRKDAEFINELLQHCAMDDIGGILVTEEKRSVPRKSVCEFGWVAAIPELSRTESYFHVKYVSERGAQQLQ